MKAYADFEKVLIPKCILFKKVAIMPYGKTEKFTGTICNVPVDNIDVTNLLLRTADSNGVVIVKLKLKVEYRGHVLFETVRPGFLRRILSYLKQIYIYIFL